MKQNKIQKVRKLKIYMDLTSIADIQFATDTFIN